MDLFKLFFEHDLRLDQLYKPESSGPEMSIEDFMKPMPVYSKFYLTGTHLEGPRFGLNALDHFESIVQKLDRALDEYYFYQNGNRASSLLEVLEHATVGDAILMAGKDEPSPDISTSTLNVTSDSNVGHIKAPLRNALEHGWLVLYKEHAHHGFDLHLFSEENIYHKLFYPLKELVGDDFRFFSINNKRIRSERQFYFETWTLDRPPHGAEEVHPETVL